jgi:hypothetical protein
VTRRPNEPVDVFKLYDMRGDDECWPWLGTWGGLPGVERRPYFQAGNRRQIAYRWVFELVNGVVLTRDQLILHACDNGATPIGCGNPAHLRIGTHDENFKEMTDRGRHGMPAYVVRAIRKLLSEGVTHQEIADRYGVVRETITAIATMRAHRHVSANEDGTDQE